MVKQLKLNVQEILEKIKSYVILMLGAPIVQVELDEMQLAMCSQRVCEFMDSSGKVAKWDDSFKLMVAQDGALAHAKMILGRVRAKYGFVDKKGVNTKSKLGTNVIFPMDGDRLLSEGEKEYHAWRELVFGKINDN